MGLYDLLKPVLVPLHREGYRFFIPLLIVTFIFLLLYPPLGFASTLLTLWCYYFFRDPERVSPTREDHVVAPADGIICALVKEEAPQEIGLPSGKLYWRISIFMSVFDCHVNRMPVAGVIENIAYSPGKFLNASLDKSSKENERNSLLVKTTHGHFLGVVQIAGLIARRILCYPTEGARLALGERYGIIRFGSRVDVYLPESFDILVLVGQKSVGGETILAIFPEEDETDKQK